MSLVGKFVDELLLEYTGNLLPTSVKVLYHGTEDYNIPAIKREGLLPSGSMVGHEISAKREKARVWFALTKQEAISFAERRNVARAMQKGAPLASKVAILTIVPDPHIRFYRSVGNEYATLQHIPPSCIRQIDYRSVNVAYQGHVAAIRKIKFNKQSPYQDKFFPGLRRHDRGYDCKFRGCPVHR
jgi:hypothetical protein